MKNIGMATGIKVGGTPNPINMVKGFMPEIKKYDEGYIQVFIVKAFKFLFDHYYDDIQDDIDLFQYEGLEEEIFIWADRCRKCWQPPGEETQIQLKRIYNY
jgi:hypothetical protein